VAVEGQRPVLTATPISPLDSLSIGIAGNSVGTALLVGRLTVRTGVAPGIDWASARKVQ
jgi:hypothetical protein